MAGVGKSSGEAAVSYQTAPQCAPDLRHDLVEEEAAAPMRQDDVEFGEETGQPVERRQRGGALAGVEVADLLVDVQVEWHAPRGAGLGQAQEVRVLHAQPCP